MKVQNDLRVFLNARAEVWICLALCVCIIIAYWNVWTFELITFDDPAYVSSTCEKLKSTKGNILWVFGFHQRDGKYWQPLSLLSHAIDCRLFGTASGMHHFTNLLFHFGNCLLLFFILRRTTGKIWNSSVVVLFFAVHPINVESVAWISERKNLISTFFFLLTIQAYIHFTHNRSRERMVLLIFSYILGLLAKPMLITVPAVLLLLDYWPLNQFRLTKINTHGSHNSISTTRLFLEKSPFLVIAILSVFITTYSVKEIYQIMPAGQTTIQLRIANALVSIWLYINKIICPQNLSIFYPFPNHIPFWQPLASLCAIICITVILIVKNRSVPYLLMGWLWFLITLAPVLGLIQAGLWPEFADRWAYVPMIGFLILSTWGMSDIISTISKYHKSSQQITIRGFCLNYKRNSVSVSQIIAVMVSCSILILMLITWKQVRHWQNSQTLYAQAIRATPNNFMAFNNLGRIKMDEGSHDEARRYFLRALDINPTYLDALLNLANLYITEKNYKKAIEIYRQLLHRFPNYARAWNNIGVAQYRSGKTHEAVKSYLAAIQKDSGYAEAYQNLGVALSVMGKINEADQMFKKALLIEPYYLNAIQNLKKIAIIKRDIYSQIAAINKSLQLTPGNPALWIALGEQYQSLGDNAGAAGQYQKAIKIQSDSSTARHKLSIALAMQGKYTEAVSEFQTILSYQPDYLDAYYYIAALHARQNNIPDAIHWLHLAAKKGFTDWKRIDSDANFDGIRENEQFKKMIDQF